MDLLVLTLLTAVALMQQQQQQHQDHHHHHSTHLMKKESSLVKAGPGHPPPCWPGGREEGPRMLRLGAADLGLGLLLPLRTWRAGGQQH